MPGAGIFRCRLGEKKRSLFYGFGLVWSGVPPAPDIRVGVVCPKLFCWFTNLVVQVDTAFLILQALVK